MRKAEADGIVIPAAPATDAPLNDKECGLIQK
jgi:hypothetical protein